MTPHAPDNRARRSALARQISAGGSDAYERLLHHEKQLEVELFGDPVDIDRPLTDDDPRIPLLLDALTALRIQEPTDPANPWRAAAILKRLGKHAEAALVYLEAARLFDTAVENGMVVTGDEADWAKASRCHAARCLAADNRLLALAALRPHLNPSECPEVLEMVDNLLGSAEPPTTP